MIVKEISKVCVGGWAGRSHGRESIIQTRLLVSDAYRLMVENVDCAAVGKLACWSAPARALELVMLPSVFKSWQQQWPVMLDDRPR